ncbi:MAG: DUF4391 domain-containing protein [Methanobrevibacter boviskoreani]|uniref:DUF4391 domain-containing protein n=1 Tax=Methanobrevibacter boviskoreani TaxID=1348249 RepID=UPI0023A909F3|nr:DUF4391 domain-containing protein [Methanobrevibacter boviskoreani]MCI6774269.1 DUF4391 domain-containing protein [Methanobrevibacter boviskoreani]MDY5613724.1 DUF4391 domain-containing protein [Methanobrevibacter boviskoreani]
MEDVRDVLIYKYLNDIPESCKIDFVITKKEIFNEGNLKIKDQNLFTKYVRQIKWSYKFSNDTIRLEKHQSDTRNYEEIEIINLILKDDNLRELKKSQNKVDSYFKQDKQLNRIVEIIFRTIRYPLVVILQYKSKIRAYVTNITINKVDSTKYTLDDIIKTNWIDLEAEEHNEFEEKLFEDLKLDNLDFTNAYTFYNSILGAIVHYNGSRRTGTNIVDKSTKEIRSINKQIEAVNRKIRKLEQEVKNETQFNRKVELNMEFNKLKNQKEELKTQLKEEKS